MTWALTMAAEKAGVTMHAVGAWHSARSTVAIIARRKPDFDRRRCPDQSGGDIPPAELEAASD